MPSWDIKPAEVQQPVTAQQPGIEKGSVMILVPHRDDRDYRAWRDWFHFKLKRPAKTAWRESRGACLVTTRNALTKDALASNCEYFFWLDDDNIGPDDGLMTLLSLNLPIACGLYWAKKAKKERCLAAWMKSPNGKGYIPVSGEQKSRHIQVDVTGLGFALFHRSVFERLSYPYFVWDIESVSEDFFLFNKIWDELKIKPVIDREVKCSHLGSFSLEPDGSFDILGL